MLNCTLIYIENPDGQYLMLHRVKKKNDINHDKWIGIGGKFEEGESPEECIIRETKEETGFTLTDFKFRGIVTFVSNLCPTEYIHVFTATGYTGDMIECNEGDLAWVDKDKVLDLPLWEGDKLFLKLIADPDYPFFSMKMRYDGDKLVEASVSGEPMAF